MKANSYDLNTHPRVPVIVAHNQLVSQTFTMTAALLEQMGQNWGEDVEVGVVW